MGGTLMLLALVAPEAALLVWVLAAWDWSLLQGLLGLAVLNLVVASISLRVGGQLAESPYLPQTLEGLSRTTRAVLGR